MERRESKKMATVLGVIVMYFILKVLTFFINEGNNRLHISLMVQRIFYFAGALTISMITY